MSPDRWGAQKTYLKKLKETYFTEKVDQMSVEQLKEVVFEKLYEDDEKLRKNESVFKNVIRRDPDYGEEGLKRIDKIAKGLTTASLAS